MSLNLHLYSNLPQYAGNKTLVEVDGVTIGQCLNDLVRQYPGLQSRLFDQEGNLRTDVFVSINLRSPGPEPPGRKVKEGDELYLILIVAGG
jgi:molybdopterin converting factor small subunit